MRLIPRMLVLLLLVAARPTMACDPTNQLGDRLDGPAPVAGEHGCQPFAPCVEVTSVYPFERVGTAPVFPIGGCFSVARNASRYVLLVNEFDLNQNPGFYRTISTDGETWDSLSSIPPFPNEQAWFGGIKCPDLQFRDDGKLHLYFKGQDTSDGNPKFGYAVSSDLGRSWSIHPTPVFQSDLLGWEGKIDMPSIIDTGIPGTRRFLMAYYADPVGAEGLEGEIGLAFSPDGITWSKHPENPVVRKGTLPWNCNLAGRPRLLLAPDGAIHMFYAGSRTCIKVLHAVSIDQGSTWSTDPVPYFDWPADPAGWDYQAPYYCTSFTWDPYPSRLQMFYTSAGYQVGLAEADWPLLFPVSAPEPLARTVALSIEPNPFQGSVLIRARHEGSEVGTARLRVHDVSGRLLQTLWSGGWRDLPASLEWNGRTMSGESAATGRYLLTLSGDGRLYATQSVLKLR